MTFNSGDTVVLSSNPNAPWTSAGWSVYEDSTQHFFGATGTVGDHNPAYGGSWWVRGTLNNGEPFHCLITADLMVRTDFRPGETVRISTDPNLDWWTELFLNNREQEKFAGRIGTLQRQDSRGSEKPPWWRVIFPGDEEYELYFTEKFLVKIREEEKGESVSPVGELFEIEEYKKKVEAVLDGYIPDSDERKTDILKDLGIPTGDPHKGGSIFVTEGHKKVYMFFRTESNGKWMALNWYDGTLYDKKFDSLEDAKKGIFSWPEETKLVKIFDGWPGSKHGHQASEA